ncbi:NepR family anti-sigma factor [Falsiroseomonas sp. CW058]|uniref:NepR family anti-sigma factor n=1 Tax=Falsiroseomonas sp. CW058 TaxID=3388664 RepID=UPI003D3108F5
MTSSQSSRQGGPEAAFELWLNHRLHQLYDSVAQEPLPPDLLRLIETDRTRRGE